MKLRWPVVILSGACVVASLLAMPLAADEGSDSFRAVLESSGVGPDKLAELSKGRDINEADWQLMLPILNRLQQFRELEPVHPTATAIPKVWLSQGKSVLGEIFEIEGQITTVEEMALPESLIELKQWKTFYRCTFQFLTSENEAIRTVTILTTRIPRGWQAKQSFQEPVRIRGVLVRLPSLVDLRHPLLLTHHIAWYPTAEVPTGQLLLARQGMDIALLDEVIHRQPFVKPEISREGKAFYAALKALSQTNPQEIAQLARENVDLVAGTWRARQPELRGEHHQLETELAKATDDAVRKKVRQRVRQAKLYYDLASTVLKQSELGQSSVAPMFIQPEQEVGELVIFEGTARRAVRIIVEGQDDVEGQGDLEAYYETEVYPIESRLLDNRPIVCCFQNLPSGFPTGDEIREPVRISGVFFKSWRYRSRKLIADEGETARQRQLYTPVMLGRSPTWLNTQVADDNRWALWGGIAFLGGLALLWICMAWLARRDRQARASLQRPETIDL